MRSQLAAERPPTAIIVPQIVIAIASLLFLSKINFPLGPPAIVATLSAAFQTAIEQNRRRLTELAVQVRPGFTTSEQVMGYVRAQMEREQRIQQPHQDAGIDRAQHAPARAVAPGADDEGVAESAVALRGWAAMVRQLEERPDRAPVTAVPARLADFVALVKTELRHSDEYLRAVEAGVANANKPAIPAPTSTTPT